MVDVAKGRGQRMSVRPIPLSRDQAYELGMEGLEVRALAYPESGIGDGRVVHGGIVKDGLFQGGHLAGNFVRYVARRTVKGRKHSYHIAHPLNSLLSLAITQDWLLSTADRIGGYQDESGQRVEGEIDAIQRIRQDALNWSEMTDETKQADAADLAGIAKPRMRARNPLEIAVGEQALKVAGFKDRSGRENPGAFLAATLSMPENLTNRFAELMIKDYTTNVARLARERMSLRQEQSVVNGVRARLGALAVSQSREDYYGLLTAAYGLNHLFAPFGPVAYAARQNKLAGGPGIPDPDSIQAALNGLDYHQRHSFFDLPFRIIGSMTQPEIKQNSDRLGAMVTERQAELAATRPGGEYDALIGGRLEPLAEAVVTGLSQNDAKQAKRAAEVFLFAHTYHIYRPQDNPAGRQPDPKAEVWYRYRLS